MYHSLNCRLMATLFMVLPLVGESVAQNSSNAQSSVTFRVLTFDRVKDLKAIDLIAGEERQSVSMHKNNFTGPYKSKSRELRFCHPTLTDKKGEPVLVGKIKVPSSLGSKVLLVAVPTKKQQYHFFPIPDDVQKFGKGEMKLINLTNVGIAARLNNKPFRTSPLTVSNLGKLSQKKEPHSYPAEFFSKKGKKWSQFSSSYWYHEPDIRQLAFLFREPKTGRIRVKTIRDFSGARPQRQQ